jgi:glyoxylase-like metal-dependent hydrolase (beta-lactamase superfamily II)
MNLEILKSIVLVAGLAAAAPAVAQEAGYAPIGQPLRIEQFGDRPIYYSIGDPGIPGKDNEGNTSNAGFVVTSQGVVVFDALGTPSHGWALLQAIRNVTDQPIRYVVASHYHADHIYGLQPFKDHSDAVIVAQVRAAEYDDNEQTADERAEQRLDQRREALEPWVNADTRVVPPDITFDQTMTLSLGAHTFTLTYAGPAHSVSDLMMMVEPEGVLFAGDVVQNSRIPFMNSDEVDTENWLAGLALVARLDPKFVIPGHGAPFAEADKAIAFTRDYIEYVRVAMREAVENWTDFDTAYVQTDWSRYEGIAAFDNNNRGNAFRIYLDMEAAQLEGAD